jgi:MYXO-CTERM domain-containing protein
MQSRKPSRLVLSGIVAAAFVTLTPSLSRASEEFPAALQEAAGMPCTPTCTICHGKTPGDPQSFYARKLPQDLVKAGSLPPPHDTGVLKTDVANYIAKSPTDPEAARVVQALKQGTDPQTGAKLCEDPIVYGCAVHAASKTPARDYTAPILALGAVLLGGLARRRKRS